MYPYIQAAIPSRLKTKALARIPIVVRSTLVSNALFYSAYMLLRRPVLRFVITSIMGSYARWAARPVFNRPIAS